MPTSSTPVSWFSDDGYVDSFSYVTDQTANVGDPDGFNPANAWLRFSTTGIPQGATITSAKVTFKHNYAGSFSDLHATIRAEFGTDNPSAPSDSSDYWARSRTTASAAWDETLAHSAGDLGETDDFASVMQEIVNQSLWNENQAVLLFLENSGSSAGAYVGMVPYDWFDVTPTLVVEYEASGPTYGELTGTATISLTATGTLTASGSLAGSAGVAFSPGGLLAGVGALAGAATIALACAGSLDGTGSLAGNASLSFTPTAILTGQGALAGNASIGLDAEADLTGERAPPGYVCGEASIRHPYSGKAQVRPRYSGTARIQPTYRGTATINHCDC